MKTWDEPQQKAPTPPIESFDSFRANLKRFSPKRNEQGRYQDPFELYMLEKGVISLDSYGRWQVRSGPTLSKYDDLRDRCEKYDWAKLQEVFQEFPEEKDAFYEKMEKWKAPIRDMMKGVYADKKLV